MNERQKRWIEDYRMAGDKNRSMGEKYYAVVEFEQEDLGRGKIMVSRKYGPIKTTNVFYIDCYILGPRCGKKEIYNRLY